MRMLTISLQDSTSALHGMRDSFVRAWHTGEYQGEVLSYATPEQLFSIFTPQRWGLIAYLQRQSKPISVQELACRLKRDPNQVLADVETLLAEGVLEQGEDGVSIPYLEIHTDFTLRKAA